MKILTRYILTQFFTIFLIALTLMTSVVILYVISEATVNKGLPLYLAVRLIPCSIPYLLSVTMPVTSLLGATLCFAKMVGSNEIIALKAMGVPPWRVFLPVWIATFFLSFLTIWCNDLSFSWGRRETAKVVFSGTEEMILGKLASEGKFSDPDNNIILKVARVTKTDELEHISFQFNQLSLKGEAERGSIHVDFKAVPPVLRVKLIDTFAEVNGNYVTYPGEKDIEVPLDNFRIGDMSKGDPAIKDVKKTLEEIRKERDKIQRKNGANLVFAMVRGDFDTFEDKEWGERWDEEERLKSRYYRVRLAAPRYIAAGFTCFFFAWIGIPLAVWLNCSDYFTSFFVSFLPTLIVYYPLLMFGYSSAKSGLLPPWICWAGNVVLGIIGIWILKKIHKH